ncbi:MAG: tRNA adenosine(34) deaminase TadA [Gammaproteobacteria bacterium]|nr:tRNA adenosine(34) deaminase TadA [Pseudomonadota bacterium]PCH63357.1 MAG: tRNA adenosine(34) deaminase TadA [Gammaproteobacteria bacterium]
MSDDIRWMAHALALAQQAELQGEVPVGAVIVRDGEMLGEGWNKPIMSHDPTAHAEIQALRAACQQASNYRLPGATLYVTLEPCVMCAGALIHARIERIVFAATEPKTGAAGSCFDIFNNDKLNHRVICDSGVLATQSGELLRNFFRSRR